MKEIRRVRAKLKNAQKGQKNLFLRWKKKNIGRGKIPVEKDGYSFFFEWWKMENEAEIFGVL